MHRRRDLKVNTDKSKMMVLGGKEGLDSEILEKVMNLQLLLGPRVMLGILKLVC